MALAPSYLPVTFAAAKERLNGRTKRKVGNHTWLERLGQDIVVTYHATDIVSFLPNGEVVLRTGGYRTATTKARLHYVASAYGVAVFQKDYQWFLRHRATEQVIPWRENVEITRLFLPAEV